MSSNAVNNTINGANAIAIQRIQILIINTIDTINNGIAIAIMCHRLRAVDNTAQYSHISFGITPTVFSNDEYNAVKTQT